MVSVNKILDKEEISPTRVNEKSRNVIVTVKSNKVSIKIDPKEANELELTKDQAVMFAHMILARSRMLKE